MILFLLVEDVIYKIWIKFFLENVKLNHYWQNIWMVFQWQTWSNQLEGKNQEEDLILAQQIPFTTDGVKQSFDICFMWWYRILSWHHLQPSLIMNFMQYIMSISCLCCLDMYIKSLVFFFIHVCQKENKF